MVHLVFQTSDLSQKKDQILEHLCQMSQVSSSEEGEEDSSKAMADNLRSKLHREMTVFAQKISTLAAAKRISDSRIARLMEALRKVKSKSLKHDFVKHRLAFVLPHSVQ